MAEWLSNFALSDIHVKYPGWLWATALSLSLLLWLLRAHRLQPLGRFPALGTRAVFRHPGAQLLAVQADRTSLNVAQWKQGLSYALFIVLLHLSLAHPYRIGQQLPQPSEYRDTVLIVDTSISMVLRDYENQGERVPRMQVLKSVLGHFVDQLSGNRIAVIPFSEQAYTLLPPSADYELIKFSINRLQPALLTGRRSDVSHALLYSLQQLQQWARDDDSKPALVLLSDVNRSDRSLDPRSIAAYLHQLGYRLYCIGIGAASFDAQDQQRHGLIYQPANFELLKQIAEQGGGEFFWADSVQNLQAAIHAIQSRETRELDLQPVHTEVSLFQWPLALALLWLFVAQLRSAVRGA